MAARRHINLETLPVKDKYKTVANEQVSLQREPAADWNKDLIGTIPMWSGLRLEVNQIEEFGRIFFHDLENGEITPQTAIRGLRLSLSLKSMNPSTEGYLLVQPIRPVVPTENTLALVPLPSLSLFSNQACYTVAEQGEGEASENAAQDQVEAELGEDSTVLPAVDSPLSIKTSYAFVAIYLMKLLIKAPNNVFLGLKNMKKRYNGFYGPSRLVNLFNCSLVRLTAYKDALLSQSHINTSYTLAIAHTHQNLYTRYDNNEKGVLTYLCFLPFAYTGLHAYTMMLDLQAISKAPLDKLITLFDSDIMSPALNKITDVIRNFERTVTNPDRDVTFRYCACWGPHYFADLRSKNCTHLVYTLAHTWARLNETSEYANPEKIAAVEKLSAYMKATLARAGDIIADTLIGQMFGGVGASPAFAMALAAQEDILVPDKEIDWNEYSAE